MVHGASERKRTQKVSVTQRSMERVSSLCVCAGLLLVTLVVCSTGSRSSQGKEFILGFLQNEKHYQKNHREVDLVITTLSNKPATVTVTAPGFDPSWEQLVIVSRVRAQKVVVPPEIRGDGIEQAQKAVWIRSTEEVSVCAVNMEHLSTGAFLSLPLDLLGQEYYAVTYVADAALMVVATRDDTQVNITWPTQYKTLNFAFQGTTYSPGDTLTLTLHKFGTFHVFLEDAKADLTGAYVTSDKPIAVLSGNRKVSVPPGGRSNDHFAVMLLPVNSWGTQFITTSTPDRSIGDVLRIVASQDRTIVQFSDRPSLTIWKAGLFKTVDLPTDSFQVMRSNKPIMVVMFSKTFKRDESGDGDPSMTLIIPETQYASQYAWSTFTDPTGRQFSNKVSVVIDGHHQSGLQLDGTSTSWPDRKVGMERAGGGEIYVVDRPEGGDGEGGGGGGGGGDLRGG